MVADPSAAYERQNLSVSQTAVRIRALEFFFFHITIFYILSIYTDILGDRDIYPTEALKEVPEWLRGFHGNEYQMLLRRKKLHGQSLMVGTLAIFFYFNLFFYTFIFFSLKENKGVMFLSME